MTTKAKGLHAKLAEVMAEAERIPKNGTYPGQGNWKYVLVGDAADYIRQALGSRGVSMLPTAVEVVGESEYTVKSGTAMSLMTIRTTWTLTDGETGESAVIQSIGSGADAGDKASPKAQTNAMKYALLMGFQLSTGDDPEQHEMQDRQPTGQHSAETLELLGRVDVKGKAVAGGSAFYKGDWRQTPDGLALGFRLERGDDKDIPQVLIVGDIADALAVAEPDLLGKSVHMKGRLYAVKQPNRTTYNRLVIGEAEGHFVETDEVRIPASDSGATPPGMEVPEGSAEAPSAELPWDAEASARLDAESAA